MTPEEMKRFFGFTGKSDQNKSLSKRMKKMTGQISEKELELFKRLIPKSK